MGHRTPLFDCHQQLGAKMVDFGGWDMPIHYGSQLEEHHSVRTSAGAFDVSHMTVLEIHAADPGGPEAFLDRLLANDIRRLTRPGQAMYSAMLNEEGGVLDDLIVYATGNPALMVVNCATREKDIAWMSGIGDSFGAEIRERDDLAVVAVQGPKSESMLEIALNEKQCAAAASLVDFQGCWSDGWFLARTGYTGEQGMEVLVPSDESSKFWDALMDAGVKPVGLGARDTLRLEAGMNLYGSELNEAVSPFEANMGTTVKLDERDFIGAAALREQLRSGGLLQQIGVLLVGKGVLRANYSVFSEGELVGEVTSGAYSPTLQMGIGLAQVESFSKDMSVEIRGRRHPIEAVTPAFIRRGRPIYKQLID